MTLSVYAAITLLSVVVNSVLYLVRRVRSVKEKTDWCVCLEGVSSFVVLEELQEKGVSSFVVLEELGDGVERTPNQIDPQSRFFKFPYSVNSLKNKRLFFLFTRDCDLQSSASLGRRT